jgi:hypothetical protein
MKFAGLGLESAFRRSELKVALAETSRENDG